MISNQYDGDPVIEIILSTLDGKPLDEKALAEAKSKTSNRVAAQVDDQPNAFTTYLSHSRTGPDTGHVGHGRHTHGGHRIHSLDE